MKGDRVAKRSSFGGLMRKRLSDITNQSQPKLATLKENKQTQVTHSAEDLINQILMEKATLVKLVEERNKVIALSGNELRNLRINCQKLQLQNWHLAQSNSQLVALKALQHELVGKDALLKAKKMEPEEKSHMNSQHIGPLHDGEKAEKCLRGTNDDIKPSNRSRRRTAARSKSMSPSTTNLQLAEKQRAENKRFAPFFVSVNRKFMRLVPSKTPFTRCRRCVRRQSARFKSQERESEENLFEIEDVRLSMQETGLCGSSSLTKEENSGPRNEAQASDRCSIGKQPSRRAVEKVQSYKEVPLNVKMRRKE